MKVYSVNTFTNPNGERVRQAFLGGMPITREFPVDDPRPWDTAKCAHEAAVAAGKNARLETWNAEEGAVVVRDEVGAWLTSR